MFKTKFILQFYHVKCAFAAFERVKTEANVISNLGDIDGMETMSETDQQRINLMVTELKAKCEKVLRKPMKSKGKPLTDPSTRSPTIQIELPEIIVSTYDGDNVHQCRPTHDIKNG